MADTDGPMDCITAHAQEETKDIPQHVAVQRMMLYHQVHEASGLCLLPKYISSNYLVQAQRQGASVQAQHQRALVQAQHQRAWVQTQHKRDNGEQTDQEQSTVRT